MAKLLIGSFSIDPIRWCQNNETQSTKSNSRPNHHDHRIMSDSFFQLACVRNCHSFLLQPYLEENQKLLIVVEGHFCSLVHNATSSILFAKSTTFIPGLINSFTSTHDTSIVRDSCCQSIIHHHHVRPSRTYEATEIPNVGIAAEKQESNPGKTQGNLLYNTVSISFGNVGSKKHERGHGQSRRQRHDAICNAPITQYEAVSGLSASLR